MLGDKTISPRYPEHRLEDTDEETWKIDLMLSIPIFTNIKIKKYFVYGLYATKQTIWTVCKVRKVYKVGSCFFEGRVWKQIVCLGSFFASPDI